MDCTYLTDLEITQRYVQDADPRLFAELVRRHQPNVVQQCWRLVKDADVAQDISQEVWIRVLTKLHQFRADRPFGGWLSIIVRNRCYDHLQQDKRLLHQEISRKVIDTLKEEEALETEDFTKSTIEILEELLGQIGGEEKLLLLLKYEQRWSIKAIQQNMQLSESAVKSQLFRTKKKLYKLLNVYRKNNLTSR